MKIIALNDSVVVQLPCTTGDTVKEGDIVVLTEVMKMMIDYPAPCDGIITYHVTENQMVYGNALLAEVT